MAFVAALAGALVGGLASALGSHWSTRADRVRDVRAEIYRDLLPVVWTDTWGPKLIRDEEAWDDIARAARTARRKDARFANTMLDLHGDALVAEVARDGDATWTDEEGVYRPTEEGQAAHDAALGELDVHLRAWSRWLEKKLR